MSNLKEAADDRPIEIQIQLAESRGRISGMKEMQTRQHNVTIEKCVAEVKKLIGTHGVNDFVIANLIDDIKQIQP